MKRLTVADIVMWFLFTLLIAIMIMGACGCSTNKHIVSQSSDSTVLREYQDSIRTLIIERNKLTDEVAELQYGVIRFDTIYQKGDTIFNTVTITKEGEIKASGKIKEAVISKSFWTKTVQEKDRVIDSLKLVKAKEIIRTVTKYVDRKVKRSFLYFWWLFLLGLGTGLFIYKKLFK